MKKEHKDPSGGLTAKGRRFYNQSTGSNLKPGVKDYSSASHADKQRWTNWASRFTKTPRPLTDKQGRPTRYALMFQAWGEPIPKSTAHVKAVHSKAVQRRTELANSRPVGARKVSSHRPDRSINKHPAMRGDQ